MPRGRAAGFFTSTMDRFIYNFSKNKTPSLSEMGVPIHPSQLSPWVRKDGISNPVFAV